jgi:hypothetical protein
MHDDRKSRLLQEPRVDRGSSDGDSASPDLPDCAVADEVVGSHCHGIDCPLEKPEAKQAQKRAAFAALKIYADAV